MLEQRISYYYPRRIPKVGFGESTIPDIARSPFGNTNFMDHLFHAISTKHGRSVEVAAIANKVLWEDEFGNLYGSRSLKGLPLRAPKIQFDPYAPFGLRTFGLKDNLSSDRVETASAELRSAQVETERPVGKTPVKEVLIGDQVSSIEDWKKQTLAEGVVPDTNGELIDFPRSSLEDYLNRAQFEVLHREYQVGERIIDIQAAATEGAGKILSLGTGKFFIPEVGAVLEADKVVANPNTLTPILWDYYKNHPEKGEVFRKFDDNLADIVLAYLRRDYVSSARLLQEDPEHKGVITSPIPVQKVLHSVFPWLNSYIGVKAARKEGHAWQKFGVDDTASVFEYMESFLPFQMGRYLAKFALLDYTHGFATPHNWSAAATLYDLDSVESPSLGDQPSSIKRQASDINSSLVTLLNLLSVKPLNWTNYEGESYPEFSYFAQKLGQELYATQRQAGINFLAVFLASYQNSSASSENKNLKLSIVEELLEKHQEVLGDMEKTKKELEID